MPTIQITVNAQGVVTVNHSRPIVNVSAPVVPPITVKASGPPGPPGLGGDPYNSPPPAVGTSAPGSVSQYARGDHTHTGLTQTVADGLYEPLGTAASAVSAHEAAADPHPAYLTAAEGDASYDALGSATAVVAVHEADGDPHAQYVLNTGDTMTGDLIVSHSGSTRIVASSSDGQPSIMVNAPAGQGRAFTFATDWAYRWSIGANNAPESGGNAGSDFDFARYSDAGDWLGTSLSIARASGHVSVFELLTLGAGMNANNQTVYGLSEPTDTHHAATKGYVDTSLSAGLSEKVHKTGDVMTGSLGMSNNPIYNLGTPSADDHAATKGYVDGEITAHEGAADPHAQYVLNTGDTINGLLDITGAPAQLGLRSDSYASIYMKTAADSWRWAYGKFPAPNHDWGLSRFDDSGNFVDDVLLISRASGVADFLVTPTVSGTEVSLAGHGHAEYQLASEKGAANGYAPLDGTGKVPEANLPAGQAPVTDHGNLTGLTDDDHPIYLLADGSRPATGNIDADGLVVGKVWSGAGYYGLQNTAVGTDSAALMLGNGTKSGVTYLIGNPGSKIILRPRSDGGTAYDLEINTDGVTLSSGAMTAPSSVARTSLVLRDGIHRTNLGDPTIYEAALFEAQAANRVWFYPFSTTTYEYTTDGTNWLPDTAVTEAAHKKLFAGVSSVNTIGAPTVQIPNGALGYRITIRNDAATGYCYLNDLYLYMSPAQHRTLLKIQKKRDDGDWVDHTDDPNELSGWPAHQHIPHPTIPFSLAATASHYNEVRLLFTPRWITQGNQYDDDPIPIYGIEWWGGYPQGRRTIYTVDQDKNVAFPARVHAAGAEFTANMTVKASGAIVDSAGTAYLALDKGAAGNFAWVEYRTAGVPTVKAGMNSAEEYVLSVDGSGTALSMDPATRRVSVPVAPVDPDDVVNRSYADGLITTHEAAGDPHPQYTNPTLADGFPTSVAQFNNAGTSAEVSRADHTHSGAAYDHTHPQTGFTRTGKWTYNATAGIVPAGTVFTTSNGALDAGTTWLRFDDTDLNSIDQTTYIVEVVKTGSTVVLQRANDATKWVTFDVTGDPTHGGTYAEVPVALKNSGAALDAWQDTLVDFAPASGTATGGGHTIEDEGTPLTQRASLNFVGAGVTATDDAGNDATVITISGGGSGTEVVEGDKDAPPVALDPGDFLYDPNAVLPGTERPFVANIGGIMLNSSSNTAGGTAPGRLNYFWNHHAFTPASVSFKVDTAAAGTTVAFMVYYATADGAVATLLDYVSGIDTSTAGWKQMSKAWAQWPKGGLWIGTQYDSAITAGVGLRESGIDYYMLQRRDDSNRGEWRPTTDFGPGSGFVPAPTLTMASGKFWQGSQLHLMVTL